MNNKDKILTYLKEATYKLNGENDIGVTAQQISDKLNIQRSLVSHILNQFCTEGVAIKTTTRPVYFLHKEIYEDRVNDLNKSFEVLNKKGVKKVEDEFSKLIGYNGSLKEVIRQCKSAVVYPPNGLPFILSGSSGVGKSYLAKLVFEYSKAQGVIDINAAFVIFNCAEYANNHELLSATLFGSCKGAYTGAEKDKRGLIEEANGGILFLDEFHRLSPEGQEKLFLFLDKGVFRRLGETGKWRKANVRLIFATTENLQKSFLETFLRRIPLTINIPSFEERPLNEKIELIKYFFNGERGRTGRDIVITAGVMNLLLNSKYCNNIGKLSNIIKITCANSYQHYVKGKTLEVGINDLPKEVLECERGNDYKELRFKDIVIDLDSHRDNGIIDKDNEILLQCYKIIEAYMSKDHEEFLSKIEKGIYNLIDSMIFEEKNKNLIYYTIRKIVEDSLNFEKEIHSVKSNSNAIEILTNIIVYFIENTGYKNEEAYNRVKEWFNKAYQISENINKEVKQALGIEISKEGLLFMTLYLKILNKETKAENINVLIMAHGHSTASSISIFANRILGEYIFEALDIPLELRFEEEVTKLKNYINKKDKNRDLLLLVDMGSLQDIYKEIIKDYKGNIGVVNNITTSIILDIGTKIVRGVELKEIIEGIPKSYEIKSSYFPFFQERKKAIITTCMTGIGTADKIKDLLIKCFRKKDIEIYALDFNYLKDNFKDIKEKYDVKLIVGTHDPKIENVEYLSLENMIITKEENKLLQKLRNIVDIGDLDEINREIVKYFSFENVVNNLTILNPNKIIEQVEQSIFNLEVALGKKLVNEIKIGLYVHTCCMVERLVIKDCIPSYKIDEKDCSNYNKFKDKLKSSFSIIEDYYNVNIPESEIGIIYDSLKSKVKLFS